MYNIKNSTSINSSFTWTINPPDCPTCYRKSHRYSGVNNQYIERYCNKHLLFEAKQAFQMIKYAEETLSSRGTRHWFVHKAECDMWLAEVSKRVFSCI